MADKDQETRSGYVCPIKSPVDVPNVEFSHPQTGVGFENQTNGADFNMNTYKNAREYAQAVRQWLWHYHCWNSMNSFMAMMPLYAMSCPPPGGMTGSTATTGQYSSFGANHNNLRQRTGQPVQAQVRADRSAGQRQGTEFALPSFWKRVAAELIDFTLLFYIKLVVTVIVMRELGYMDGNVDYNLFFNLEELDYDKAFAITSEVIAMEIVNRLLITMFETLCLRQGIGTIGGSTPGKRLLGLKVVSCSDIIDVGHNRILVYPAQNIGWGSALVRSVIKNFTIAFFFPACLTVFFFKYSRAAYDVLASTVVVQAGEEDNI
ncbi:protein FAM8A1-like [Haliotis asinina]|uniref:protein FAM8A1-like n=1 Tax=Haliotis asinina TaxID=109174 RepID=UPI003531B166